MRNNIDQLKAILKDELEVYKKLLDITLTKKDIITLNKIQDLDNITKVEQNLIMQIGKLEEAREKTTSNISKSSGIADLSMTDLIEYLEEKDKKFFIEIRKELMSTLKHIHEGNDLNKVLIEDSLEYVNFNIELLTNTDYGNDYQANAEDKGESEERKNLFDMKA